MTPPGATPLHPDDPQDPQDPCDPNDDMLAARLRRALEQEAEMVDPQDGLDAITDRTAGGGRRRWLPWVAGLAAAAVAGTVAGVVLVNRPDAPPPDAVPSPTPTPSATPSDTGATDPPSATSSPSQSPTDAGFEGVPVAGVPVYWVGESSGAPRLFREFRGLSARSDDAVDVVTAAVAELLAGAPLDPDYDSPWSDAPVEVELDDTALVDLGGSAFDDTDVDAELARIAVQQLVHTVTAAAAGADQPVSSVTVTVDGEPADAWGVVQLGEPMTRASQLDVQAMTWLTSPQQGDQVDAGTVGFTGYGTAFEATFVWAVTTAAGDPVADGFTTGGGGGGEYGEFSFTTDLEPGDYVVRVQGDDPSDGEGPGPAVDTKDFTVG